MIMIRLRSLAHSVWLAAAIVGCTDSDDQTRSTGPIVTAPSGSVSPAASPAVNPAANTGTAVSPGGPPCDTPPCPVPRPPATGGTGGTGGTGTTVPVAGT